MLPEPGLETVTANSIIGVLSSKFIVLFVRVCEPVSVATVLSIDTAPDETFIPVLPVIAACALASV